MVLVIGCGYVGLPLALRLKCEGQEVIGWVNSEAGAEIVRGSGLSDLVIGDVSNPQIWGDQLGARIGEITSVIHCASSNRGGPDAYTKVFLRGAEQILEKCPDAHFILVSSTSVYGQIAGEVVTEESPANPMSETSQILRSTEELVLSSGGNIARSAGIYGPGRAISWEKYLSGTATIEGDGCRYMNQIHRDDLVNALCLLERLPCSGIVYNVCDDYPATSLEFYQWCAQTTGKPLPAQGLENKNRKRGLTNKRVSNAKLRELGWRPKFPSFREGLTDIGS